MGNHTRARILILKSSVRNWKREALRAINADSAITFYIVSGGVKYVQKLQGTSLGIQLVLICHRFLSYLNLPFLVLGFTMLFASHKRYISS
jgi:hypothetical protein